VDRGVKIVVASGVLAVGIATAMLFRHPSQPARPPEPNSHDKLLVLRRRTGPPVAPQATPDRLTAQTELSSEAQQPAGTNRRLVPPAGPTSDSPSMAPGEPPPRLAKNYPQLLDRTASGADPLMRSQTPRAEPFVAGAGTHKIVDGDTLRALAERYLGDGDRYLEIYEANRDVLPSPEVLPIGVELTIPGP